MNVHASARWLFLLAALIVIPAAFAQGFSKPITVIVGFPPGSTTDVIARTIGLELNSVLRQPVVIENRAGAGGTVALEAAAKAPSDGHTLLLASDSQLMLPLINPSAKINVNKEFQPVAFVGATHFALAVMPSVPAKTLQEFVALGRKTDITTASAGDIRSQAAIARLRAVTKTQLTHVPYKGSAQALVDVIAGHAAAAVLPLTANVLAQAQAGRVRVLATFGGRRLESLPQVQTAIEQGVPLITFNGYGFLAPAGTSANLVATLEKSIASVVGKTDVREKLRVASVEVMFAGKDAYRAYIGAARAVVGFGGAEPAADNCSNCTSEICRNPTDDCKVCCQKP